MKHLIFNVLIHLTLTSIVSITTYEGGQATQLGKFQHKFL